MPPSCEETMSAASMKSGLQIAVRAHVRSPRTLVARQLEGFRAIRLQPKARQMWWMADTQDAGNATERGDALEPEDHGQIGRPLPLQPRDLVIVRFPSNAPGCGSSYCGSMRFSTNDCAKNPTVAALTPTLHQPLRPKQSSPVRPIPAARHACELARSTRFAPHRPEQWLPLGPSRSLVLTKDHENVPDLRIGTLGPVDIWGIPAESRM